VISTVTITRESTAAVVVEHPDDWTDAQILGAVKNRAIDIAAEAPMWNASNRTTIGGVAVGADARDEMADEHMMQRQPIELTDEDLDPPAEPIIEEEQDV
jgi:hypothetical protein